MRNRHLRKADLAGDFGRQLLMRGKAIGVHEHNGNGGKAFSLGAQQRRAYFGFIGRAFNRAIRQHALVHLHHAGVKLLRLDDILGKNLSAGLIANFQRIAEALGCDQQGFIALTLQQRIGGDRSAHFHRANAALGNGFTGLKPQQITNALHGGIIIGRGIL